MTAETLFDQLGIRYLTDGHSHTRSGWLQMDCPYCGAGSHKYHLGFNTSRNYFNCWQCGPHPVVDTIHDVTRLSYGKIRELLKNLSRAVVADIPKTGRLQIPEGVKPMEPCHRLYLTERGFDPDEIAEIWGVKGIGLVPRCIWRLFIPINYLYETVSWTTRTIGIKEPRYLSASPAEESISHKHLLYGEDLAGHSVVAVEGPTDAWRIGPGAVATFGLTYSHAQVARLREFPRRTICFDRSPDAQKRARALVDTLSLYPGETNLVKLSGDDPDKSPLEEIRELRRRFL